MIEGRASPISIDVSTLVRGTVASLHPNLVTRPTGRAVRAAIEGRLVGLHSLSVSLIDFTQIRVLDFSCADEVVAKLLLRYMRPDRPRNAFFLFRASGDVQRHAVKEVLGRQGLAAVCDVGTGCFQLLGQASAGERRVWETLERRQQIAPGDSVATLGNQGERLLRKLVGRRLAYRERSGVASALSALAPPWRNP